MMATPHHLCSEMNFLEANYYSLATLPFYSLLKLPTFYGRGFLVP